MQLNPATHEERTHQHGAPSIFCVYTEREKETTTQPTPKAKPQSQECKTKSRKAAKQDKSKTTPIKGLFAELFDKMKGKRKGKHAASL